MGFVHSTSAVCSLCIIIDRARTSTSAVVVQETMQWFGSVINVADPAALFYLHIDVEKGAEANTDTY